MDKVKYSCKNCGWETAIRVEWADLKPKRCMNKRCNTSFIASPDALEVKMPSDRAEGEHVEEVKKGGKNGRKRKEGSSTIE